MSLLITSNIDNSEQSLRVLGGYMDEMHSIKNESPIISTLKFLTKFISHRIHERTLT